MSTCYAHPSPTFQPAMRLISAITQTNPLGITTTFDHNYVSGTIVRLVIPIADGMQEANGVVGEITVTGTDTFTFPLDGTDFTAFAIPGAPNPHADTCAMVIPIGENNDILYAATQNVLPY